MKVIEQNGEHWLDEAERVPYPADREMPVRRFLVIHFTSGASARSSIDFWKSGEAKGAEAHIIIDRDGTVLQIRPTNQRADHAGKSKWADPKTGKVYENLNSCSIGIELANAGDGANEDGTAFSSRKFRCPAGVKRARHKHGGPNTFWEIYPEAQIAACCEVAAALVSRYKLDDVIGHEDIAPLRKNDPGPLCPMDRIRKACGFGPMKS